MKYEVIVTQVDTYSKRFTIEAKSEEDAERIIQIEVDREPIDLEEKTYINSDVMISAKLYKL